MAHERFRIAQFSDIHCGDPRFDEHLAHRVIDGVNASGADLVVIPGDLTAFGYPDELDQARRLIDTVEAPDVLVIPGNHDCRNVGYVHFEELFGPRCFSARLPFTVDGDGGATVRVIAVDSSKPDLDDGEVGRDRHAWLAEQLDEPAEFKVVMLHHHLVSIPRTGRERNIVWDAGDVLEILAEHGADLVLAGHKHVPYVWPIAGMLIATSGTASTWRTRGPVPPSYNLIDITADEVSVSIVVSQTGERSTLTFPRPVR